MTLNNPRGIFKPPRCLPDDLQTLPTLPWLFSWPMNSYDRLHLTNWAHYNRYPCPLVPKTSVPYKDNWQFRDYCYGEGNIPPTHSADLRGGPSNVKNVTRFAPRPCPYPAEANDFDAETYRRTEQQYLLHWQNWWPVFGDRYMYTEALRK